MTFGRSSSPLHRIIVDQRAHMIKLAYEDVSLRSAVALRLLEDAAEVCITTYVDQKIS